MDFYMVTDSGLSKRGTPSDVRLALDAGCAIVQHREKNKSTREMVEEAAHIMSICRDRAVFIVNDRVDVALAVGADGVHLGRDDMPYEAARKLLGDGRIIGLTVHNLEEALYAEQTGADYIGLSPVFETGTKADAGKACGTARVAMVRKRVKLPIVAIGGITKANAAEVICAGADAVAAISAVVCADDVHREVREFIEIVRREKKTPF
jgi:thiamine-phosphate pyrophosphorylase